MASGIGILKFPSIVFPTALSLPYFFLAIRQCFSGESGILPAPGMNPDYSKQNVIISFPLLAITHAQACCAILDSDN